MQVAMALMWPGVPVTAWAIILPRASKTPADRSPASRTIEVKLVRISAAACSLTTETSRFQPDWINCRHRHYPFERNGPWASNQLDGRMVLLQNSSGMPRKREPEHFCSGSKNLW